MGRARPSFIYRLSMRLAQRALPFAARFDKKLARGLDARRGVTDRLSAWAEAQRDPKRPLLWVHASSVGEGLQAKPVLEAVRAEAPHWQLAYTFFSPSAERLARDRKSTRLNSSHTVISYAVFCLKKKKKKERYD